MTRKPESPSLAILLDMLTYRRPAGSKTERRFIRKFLEPLGLDRDRAGNLYKRIGTAPVLWSSHTDTVHKDGGAQLVCVTDDVAHLPPGSTSNCLGADDTTGVWLMREMILARVPGLYVFHRGEECGGIGSTYIATKTPNLLCGIKAAIALDRKGHNSVITHQFARCCSDTFADSLADALGLGFTRDSTGTFTDTANYTDLVGECTNISVGYSRQHSKDETQDLGFAVAMRDALLAIDLTKLVYSRAAGEKDPDDFDWGTYDKTGKGQNDNWSQHYPGHEQRKFADIVRDYPHEVADLLLDYGYDVETLLNEIYVRGGAVPY
jgi:hypothetical protein